MGKKEYDWILAVSDALPATAKGESLLALFPQVVVSVDQETLQELEPYIDFGAKPGKKIVFVISALDDL